MRPASHQFSMLEAQLGANSGAKDRANDLNTTCTKMCFRHTTEHDRDFGFVERRSITA